MNSIATARLVSGMTDHSGPELVGMSVASIRARYGATFNIPENARAVINGIEAAESATLAADDEVVFDRPTGTKG
jgi:hypothetical protein